VVVGIPNNLELIELNSDEELQIRKEPEEKLKPIGTLDKELEMERRSKGCSSLTLRYEI